MLGSFLSFLPGFVALSSGPWPVSLLLNSLLLHACAGVISQNPSNSNKLVAMILLYLSPTSWLNLGTAPSDQLRSAASLAPTLLSLASFTALRRGRIATACVLIGLLAAQDLQFLTLALAPILAETVEGKQLRLRPIFLRRCSTIFGFFAVSFIGLSYLGGHEPARSIKAAVGALTRPGGAPSLGIQPNVGLWWYLDQVGYGRLHRPSVQCCRWVGTWPPFSCRAMCSFMFDPFMSVSTTSTLQVMFTEYRLHFRVILAVLPVLLCVGVFRATRQGFPGAGRGARRDPALFYLVLWSILGFFRARADLQDLIVALVSSCCHAWKLIWKDR